MGEGNPTLGPSGRFSRRSLIVGGAAIGIAAGIGGTTGAAAATRAATRRGRSRVAATPTTGGTLRVGVVGGTNDLIDGQYIVAKPDQARLVAGWETLVTYDEEFNVTFDEGLAESVEATAADLYVIRLREGIEFHDGKTLGADDLVYSLNRLIDPDLGLAPALAIVLESSGISKLDERTVQVQLTQPAVTFMDTIAGYAFGVVPDGYSREGEQIGTGPFKLVRLHPGH